MSIDTALDTPPHYTTDEGLEDIFLARQPILDRQKRLVAYELLFRSCDTDKANVTEHMRATTVVVQTAFNGMGATAVLGHALGYVNVDARFLLSELVEALPADQVVLEIPESIELSEALLARLADLKAMGYSFALDDYSGSPDLVEPLLREVDLVKIDLLRIEAGRLPAITADLRRRRLRLVAQKVETGEQFEQACNLGFDLFQGYHFARPQVLSTRQQKNPAKVQLLRLLSLILGDADTAQLEAEFKRHPTLSYNLIRMVNSAAAGLRERVTSLRQAIILLGRRQLQVWMQLLLYTASDNREAGNPLLQMAATRGKLMETLAKADPASEQDDHDAAFMTGILSLVDVLLEMPREEIFKELNLSEEMKEALMFRTGGLGHLLRLGETLEEDNHREVAELLAGVPGLSLEDLLQMQLEAFFWANSIEKAGAG